MPREAEVAKLRWRCRRGMRELDTVLHAFFDRSFGSLSEEDKSRFARVLELPDPELYAYLAGRDGPADPQLRSLVERIRRTFHAQT